MRKFSAKPAIAIIAPAIVGLATLMASSNAFAQSCPADLTSLSSQIQEPDLNALLAVPLDSIVAQDGGLSQAIAATQANIAKLSSAQAGLGDADDAATHQYVADALLMANTQLAALQCRQGS